MKYLCTILFVLTMAVPGFARPRMDISYNLQRAGGDYTNFSAPDADACARACRHDDRCVAFDYASSYQQCWLKDRVPRARPAQDVISGVKRGRGNDDDGYGDGYGGGYGGGYSGNRGGGYDGGYGDRVPAVVAGVRLYDNTKRNGGDYRDFNVRSVEECARACAQDYQCLSFNYGKERGDCWLKNNVPDGFFNGGVISGVKEQQGPPPGGGYGRPDYPPRGGGYYQEPPPQPVGGIRYYDNVKRNGGDYKDFTVHGVEECAQACIMDNRCMSFNYGKERHDCWLKNNVPDGEPNPGVISGVRELRRMKSKW